MPKYRPFMVRRSPERWIHRLGSLLGGLTTAVAFFLALSHHSRAAAESDVPQSLPARDAAVQRLRDRMQAVRSLLVHYDLFVKQADGSRDRKLSVIEALDPTRHFTRVVHWYSADLYDLQGREELDPYLNSMLWTPEQRVVFREPTRTAVVSPSQPALIPDPSIQFYCGYLGLLTPQRALYLDQVDVSGHSYTARDYYFPWALHSDDWSLLEETASELVLQRSTPAISDTLRVDPQRHHVLRERVIESATSGLYLRITGSDFREIEPGLWMPHQLEVDGRQGYVVELIASQLMANQLPESTFTPAWPPGTIIVNETGSQRTVVPGGTEFLDFTVDRMRLAQETFARRHRAVAGAPLFTDPLVLSTTGVVIAAGVICTSGNRLRRLLSAVKPTFSFGRGSGPPGDQAA